MAITGDTTIAADQTLEPYLYLNNAKPNRTGCRCSCPECRADHCLYCAEDRMIMRA